MSQNTNELLDSADALLDRGMKLNTNELINAVDAMINKLTNRIKELEREKADRSILIDDLFDRIHYLEELALYADFEEK